MSETNAAFSFLKENLPLERVRIDTKRLLLRPITIADINEIFNHFTYEVTRYMMPPPAEKRTDTETFVLQALEGLAAGSNLQLVVCKRETAEFLGCCGLHGTEDPRRPEFGIWIKKEAHGSGYGMEAILGLKKWVDQHLGYDYLTYPVDRRNAPSRRIPEAMGGTVFREAKMLSLSGRDLDEVVYKIPRA